MSSKTVYNITDASPTTAFENPVRAGHYLLPANSTEITPPEFNVNTHTCLFNGTEWVVTEIPVTEPEPTPEHVPAMEQLRTQRDQLLRDTDWRMTKDYPYADQLEWEDYRFELRELPQRIANGEVPAPTLNENGMLVFDEWPLKPGEIA